MERFINDRLLNKVWKLNYKLRVTDAKDANMNGCHETKKINLLYVQNVNHLIGINREGIRRNNEKNKSRTLGGNNYIFQCFEYIKSRQRTYIKNNSGICNIMKYKRTIKCMQCKKMCNKSKVVCINQNKAKYVCHNCIKKNLKLN